MKDKIPVCCKCGRICVRGRFADLNLDGEWAGEYLSDCCGTSIIYFDSIKEVVLNRLEQK